ncbi:MAG: PAS domain S-box protein [Cypionkella sp.]
MIDKTGAVPDAPITPDATIERTPAPSVLDHGLLSLTRDMVNIARFDGTLQEVNAAWQQALRFTRAELLDQRHIDLVRPEDQDATRDAFKILAQGLPVVSLANRCFAKDGSYCWSPSDQMPVVEDGQVYQAAIIDNDRTLSQSDQLKAGALQRAIFNSANFSSIATDAKGVIQIFNVGAERMLGYTAADVINKITPADISDPQELIVRAKSLSAELATAITPGFEALVFKASRGIEDIYELTYIRKDGSRLPAVVSVTALRDAQNVIIGYLLIGTDNTARKVVEEEQKKSDQRLRDQQFYTRSLIESNIDAIMTTDPAGIITDVNKQMEALTGSTRDELIGAPFKNCFTDPDRAEAGIKLVLSEKSVTDYELTARARDGKETVVSYNATTFYDRNRTLQGVFAAARDVTERKRVELELNEARAVAESASQTKSDFLASMSHEIRTPMNAIMGIADLLAQTDLSAQQDKYVQIFRRAGDNLLNLINDILDLSKVEASQLELEQTNFVLSDQMDVVMEMVGARAKEKGLALSCEIESDVPNNVVGDPTRLRQVLMNLLGNAIKFTGSGTVSLRVTHGGDLASSTLLRFSVQDTGIGIPDEKLGRVFERFTQADSSTTRRFGGSGLGLTISKRLVELMGGQISVESSVDEGSTFSFSVPLEVQTSETHVAAVTERASWDQPLAPLRILLTEDSPDNCTITLAYLEATPYTVEIAGNGAVACEMFRAGHYDLVLMDRQMPVMDGLAATRNIRAWELEIGRSPIPIIALTASALKGDREMCLAAGCTAFLTKPLRQEVLLQAIREHCINAVLAPEAAKLAPNHAVHRAERVALRAAQYLANCRENTAKMLAELDQSNIETVATLGHNLRGSGSSFGFPSISEIGTAIQLAAEAEDFGEARKAILALASILDKIQPVGP